MDDHRRALLWIGLSIVSYALMAAFVKLASEVGLAERVLVRNLVMLLVAGAILGRRRGRPLGARGNRALLVLRALLGLGGVSCYFWSIDHLLLADAAMLNKLSPFVVLVLAWIVLGERPGRATLVALGLALAGALLVIKPRLDLSVLPALVGLASALFAGSAYTVVRALRARETPETIIFVFSLVTVVVLLPAVALDFAVPPARAWPPLLGIGFAAAGGQLGLTHALRHAPAAEVALYSYGTIVLSALLGYLVWHEVPDGWSALGGGLILAAAVSVWRQASSREGAAGRAA